MFRCSATKLNPYVWGKSDQKEALRSQLVTRGFPAGQDLQQGNNQRHTNTEGLLDRYPTDYVAMGFGGKKTPLGKWLGAWSARYIFSQFLSPPYRNWSTRSNPGRQAGCNVSFACKNPCLGRQHYRGAQRGNRSPFHSIGQKNLESDVHGGLSAIYFLLFLS